MRITWPNLDWLKRSTRHPYGPRGRRGEALPAAPQLLGVQEIAELGELSSFEFQTAPADDQRQVAVRLLRSTLYPHRR